MCWLSHRSVHLYVISLSDHTKQAVFQMAPRKGQKNRFPINTFLAIRRNVDEQLALALAKNKEYNAKAKKLKCLEAKVQ